MKMKAIVRFNLELNVLENEEQRITKDDFNRLLEEAINVELAERDFGENIAAHLSDIAEIVVEYRDAKNAVLEKINGEVWHEVNQSIITKKKIKEPDVNYTIKIGSDEWGICDIGIKIAKTNSESLECKN